MARAEQAFVLCARPNAHACARCQSRCVVAHSLDGAWPCFAEGLLGEWNTSRMRQLNRIDD
eukprot:6192274-Pleurochrysis_carterae.AAC.1